jgi:hypothetical protein
VYLVIFIQNPLMHLAEKILIMQPLTFGRDYPTNRPTLHLPATMAGVVLYEANRGERFLKYRSAAAAAIRPPGRDGSGAANDVCGIGSDRLPIRNSTAGPHHPHLSLRGRAKSEVDRAPAPACMATTDG